MSVAPGEIRGIVGPNGSGKTTLLNAISRIVRPAAGRIVFNGIDIASLRPHELAGIGLARTFQTPQVFRTLSAVENVLVGQQAALRGGLWRDVWMSRGYRQQLVSANANAERLLALVGLPEAFWRRPAEELSFGYQRRLELARALGCGPQLLLLDEPAAGLDEVQIREFSQLIRLLRGEGATIIVVEHNVFFIQEVADSVIVMNDGCRLAEGDPRTVFMDEGVRAVYVGSHDHSADRSAPVAADGLEA
jgi:ABC-type branched-subunit amino acid transport system ATPase component